VIVFHPPQSTISGYFCADVEVVGTFTSLLISNTSSDTSLCFLLLIFQSSTNLLASLSERIIDCNEEEEEVDKGDDWIFCSGLWGFLSVGTSKKQFKDVYCCIELHLVLM
jgi:hypothetical protein